jgi:tyrosine-protein phosphatase SIW14
VFVNRSPIRRRAGALLVSLAFLAPAAVRDGYAAPSGESVISSIRIDNFGRVNDRYYRGAQPKGHDYTDLAALGVKTLIDLTGGDADRSEPAMAAKAGLKYVQIPMTTHQVPTPSQLAQFMRVVADPANQPVYVHCVGGRHRTGVMTAVYRMVHDQWTPDLAFAEMKRYKFGADFLHKEFKNFVYGFHAEALRLAPAEATAAAGNASR